MGAWSAAIFGNDTSCDVRGDFRFWIGEGLSPEAATEKVLADHREELDFAESSADVWIGLAATQAQCGRLVESVRSKAMEIISSGEDLERWRELALEDDPGLVRKRAAALEKLRATLTGPPRKPTKVARQYIERTDWEIGHAIAYRLRSGRWAIMRVIQHHTGPHGQRLAVVEVCDWTGSEIPERAELEALPTGQSATLAVQLERLRQTASREGWSNAELESEIDGFIDWDNKLCLYGRRQSDFPRDRLQVAATALNVRNTHGAGTTFFGGWPALDDYLQREFGIE